MDYDVNQLAQKGLDAVCHEARLEGLHDGLSIGAQAAHAALMASFDEACTVENVFRNGDHTIVLFGDGEKTRVTYHHEPGSVYDAEKAIMACMLKHLMGSSYIRALRDFGSYVQPGAVKPACGDCRICGCRACEEPGCGNPALCDPEEDAFFQDPICCDPEEAEEARIGAMPAVECGEDDDCGNEDDEKLTKLLEGMADEPGFGPEVFPE